MSIIELVLALAIVGFVCWIILQVPMPAPFKNIILGVIIFGLVIWILQVTGLISGTFLRLR